VADLRTFATRLCDRIAEEEGISLDVIALRLRVHRGMLGHWIHGRCLPAAKNRDRLSCFLRVTPARLAEIIAAEKEQRGAQASISSAARRN